MKTTIENQPISRPVSRTRWFMLSLIMLAAALNYLDRINLSITGSAIQKEFGLNPAEMGFIYSSFLWTYTLFLPFVGILLDRIGPRILFTISIAGWSFFTSIVGFASSMTSLILCRVGVGAFESPQFPTSVKCVTIWHPTKERGLAISLYSSMVYLASGFLTPALAWLLAEFGWRLIFYVTGGLGIIVALSWFALYRDPKDSQATPEELAYIEAGGGLIDADIATDNEPELSSTWSKVRALLSHRQSWGMFMGQFAAFTVLYFFFTWFPTYLINAKGLSIVGGGIYAALPFFFAIAGGLMGGWASDRMIDNGYSITVARKSPIIFGLALSMVIVGANYTDSIACVILFMGISFFGGAMAAGGAQTLISEIAPIGLVGTLSGLIFAAGSIGGALAPIVIGFIVKATGNFNVALVYVTAVGGVGAFGYLFVVGPVYRMDIRPEL
jgi:MFS transporter, ACS family, D-galactonate transporter